MNKNTDKAIKDAVREAVADSLGQSGTAVPKGGHKVRRTVVLLPGHLADRLENWSAREERPMSYALVRALEAWLHKHDY